MPDEEEQEDQTFYCGCCGNEIAGDNEEWCDLCIPHLHPSENRFPWLRTYFALHHEACPFQDQEVFRG